MVSAFLETVEKTETPKGFIFYEIRCQVYTLQHIDNFRHLIKPACCLKSNLAQYFAHLHCIPAKMLIILLGLEKDIICNILEHI